MDVLQTTAAAVSDLITTGLKPLPSLLGFSIFDVAGALRLGLVLRQIREAEHNRAVKLQAKLVAESKEVREIEKQSLVTDIITMLVRPCCKSPLPFSVLKIPPARW